MLDLAFGLTETYVYRLTCGAAGGGGEWVAWACPRANDRAPPSHDLIRSRLGCQIIISPELEGIRLKLPPATRNMMG